MHTLSIWFYQKSAGAIALGSLIIFLVFSILVLPGQSAAAEAYSGGTGSPDTSLFYSSGDLYRMAETYGAEGRQAYIRARFTFDLAFPLVYGLFLTTCISWLLGRSLTSGSSWRLLNLFPLMAVIFDLLENISAALVIGRYPSATPIFAVLASVFTPVKWIFVSGSFGLLFLGIILMVFSHKKFSYHQAN